LSKVIAQIVLH